MEMTDEHKTVSDILSAAYQEQIINQLRAMNNLWPNKRTEEEKAESRRRYNERVALANESASKYLEITDDEIAVLHKPHGEPTTYSPYRECHGCDAGSYAESPAEWPCSTALIIMKRYSIDTSAWE